MLPIPRTLPPTHVHQTNNTLYHKETYRIQSGQRYVSTGQPLSSGNLLTYTQNNPSYHSETKHTHFPTTNPPSPYTNRRVGLNIYTYLPPTAALQHTTNTHNISRRGGGHPLSNIPHPIPTHNTIHPPISGIPPPTLPTSENPLLAMWQHAFSNLTPAEFTEFTRTQTLLETPTCPDPSGHSELLHTHITHFTNGEYQKRR